MVESCYFETSIPTYRTTYPRRRNSNASPCFLVLIASISFSFSFVSFFSTAFIWLFFCTCFSTTFHLLFFGILFFNSFLFPLLMYLFFLFFFIISPVFSFPYLSPSSFSIFLSFPSSSFYPDPHNFSFSASPFFPLWNFSEFNQKNNKYLLNKPGLRSSNTNTGRCINSLKWTQWIYMAHNARIGCL
jgi:hypothetical protein